MIERRQVPLTEEMRELLVASITEAVRAELESFGVPLEVHRDHHEFIKKELENTALRQQRNERVKTSVLGWLVITVLGGIGTVAYQLFTTLKEYWK
ncbi:hypothetical protein CARN8_3360002 [mine drainage metagenome]|uniref:Uncharacterized protein n=1 Tax=mine drainage metagenome TaxID=410659 RepID=A0A3P3ZP03_9ZZZZ